MGVEVATIAAIVGAGATAYGALQSREARKDAERQAAQQREALAALEAEPVPAVPTPDDDASKRARQRSISAQLRRRGRASTILTNQDSGSDALGA